MTKESRPTIIAGSRNIEDYDLLLKAIAEHPSAISEVISGGAHGADSLGERYAIEHGIPLIRFIPDWDKHGARKAGVIRNSEMIKYAKERGGGLILLWNGESRGSADTLTKAKKAGLVITLKTTGSHNIVDLFNESIEAAIKCGIQIERSEESRNGTKPRR